ncbi:low-density lipoprotein receptor class A domain-containing protein 4-like [Ptychodera flava]|uniref:low-density lipoprotein receptor class A domain-containing protein 4-like n=1 Tax=Ptychodera flava TaxID=63121 RepID=UPI00396A9EF5
MELLSDSLLCIGLMVISLLNITEAEECCHTYFEAPGVIQSDEYDCCKYHLKAPKGHVVVLNITELRGFSHQEIHRHCIPKLSVRNIASSSSSSSFTICNGGNVPLPVTLTSSKSEMKIVFRWQRPYQTSFRAVFTFHKQQEVETTETSSEDCVFGCRNNRCLKSLSLVCDSKDDCGDQSDEIGCSQTAFQAASEMFSSTPQSTLQPSDIPDSSTAGAHSNGPVERMGLFILIILAPITIACVCCIVIHRRKVVWRTRHPEHNQHQQVPRSDSSDSTQVRDVRYMATCPEYPSHQRQQEVLAQQRQDIMSRTSETEDFPATITLLDEEDPPHHSNISLHLHNDDEIYREGIRAPPNRIAYESEINNILTHQEQQQKYQRFTSSRAHSLERQRLIIDSKTRAPVSIVDSDLEEPPPYSSTGGPQMNNNLAEEQDLQEAPPAYSEVVTNSSSTSPYQNRHANGTKSHSSDVV